MHTRAQKAIDAQGPDAFEMASYPRHCAYLFRGSRFLGSATNCYGQHAEMGLLPRVRANQRGYRLYVQRVNSRDQLSRPCYHCSRALRRVPNVRVFYTDARGAWVEDQSLDNPHTSRWWKARASEQASSGVSSKNIAVTHACREESFATRGRKRR